jgi:hypothetical protein
MSENYAISLSNEIKDIIESMDFKSDIKMYNFKKFLLTFYKEKNTNKQKILLLNLVKQNQSFFSVIDIIDTDKICILDNNIYLLKQYKEAYGCQLQSWDLYHQS